MARLVLVFALLLLAGCAQTLASNPVVDLGLRDLQAAGQVAAASKDLLPVGDTWGACFASLSTTIGKIQAGPGLKTAGGGLFTEAMRLHVLQSIGSHIPPEIAQACGQVFLSIMLDVARRAPGGGLLP